jgi:hypothetical protein
MAREPATPSSSTDGEGTPRSSLGSCISTSVRRAGPPGAHPRDACPRAPERPLGGRCDPFRLVHPSGHALRKSRRD